MKRSLKRNLFAGGALAAVLVIVAVVGTSLSTSRQKVASGRVRNASRRGSAAVEQTKSDSNVVETKIDTESAKPRGMPGSDLDDEQALSKEFRELLKELRAALDSENRAKVIALVKKLQGREGWPDDVPSYVKQEMLDALTEFGSSCLPELAGFLADGDPDVSEAAVEAMEEMFMDFEGGDRALSEIVLTFVKGVHDRDVLDALVSELNNMRNSVKVSTALAIMDSGNADAVAVLKENADSIFDDGDGSFEIETREDIVKYGEDNPDDEDDEDTYGPETDDDSDDDDDDEDDDEDDDD